MKLTTIAYGFAITTVSVLLHYAVQAGIDNCTSMVGIVSTYTSRDFATGCELLSNMQEASLASVILGSGIVVWGVFRKSKMK